MWYTISMNDQANGAPLPLVGGAEGGAMDKGMTKDLLAFIGRCPSNFHTAAAVRRELEG